MLILTLDLVTLSDIWTTTIQVRLVYHTNLGIFWGLMLCYNLMTFVEVTLSSSNALDVPLSLVLPKSRSYILLSFDILLDIL